MKVKDLKKLLEKIDDDATVVVRGTDHNYFTATCDSEYAVNIKGELSETFPGDERYDYRFPVLVFW